MIGLAARATALIFVAAVALAACEGSNRTSSGGGAAGFGALPAQTGSAANGGTVSYGMLAGDTPSYIFPITPSADSSGYTINDFQHLMWRPLYWQTVGTAPRVNPPLSLATAPVFSHGNKTVTIHLKTGYRWSDGRPVDASDVIFSVDLVKAAVKESPANWGNFSPGFFPDNVESISAQGKYTVVMNLTQAYNPEWFFLDQVGLIIPLPSTAWAKDSANGHALDYTVPVNARKIYDFLGAQSRELSTYATNPLWRTVDGPFKLTSFDAVTDANSMVPNPAYTGPDKPRIGQLNEVAITSDLAEFTQLRAEALTVATVPADGLAQVPALRRSGYNVYGFPTFGWSYMPFNFKDTTRHWNSIIAQLYVRQALAHLLDQSAYIKGIYQGAADPAYGPVPSLPVSSFTPANAVTGLYPYSLSSARSLLRAHGWRVMVGGTDVCQNAGIGPDQCGAGIPAGTKLSFNLIFNSGSQPITAEVTAFASAARHAGIPIDLVGKSFNSILTSYNDPSAPSNDNAWAMECFGGFGEPLYPTTNAIFNTTGSFNFGGYTSATADQLIHNSVYGANPAAVKIEASFLTRDLPALFLPDNDQVVAWKKTLTGPSQSFSSLTQSSLNPEAWYFVK